MIQGVLFDLDGTLADTAADLGAALNRLLAEHGREAQPYAAIRPIASHGARGLIELGFGITPAHSEYDQLRSDFLNHYEQALCEHTRLFDEVPELLDALNSRSLRWGIVTNKPSRFTDPLVAQLPFANRPGTVVSGDTCGVPKPDPAPLLYAARELELPPSQLLYVGDAERDIEAGRRAGMTTIIADWGYIDATEQPEQWQADFRIQTPLQLLDIF
jgi:2-phosphoglycolate phosphatase